MKKAEKIKVKNLPVFLHYLKRWINGLFSKHCGKCIRCGKVSAVPLCACLEKGDETAGVKPVKDPTATRNRLMNHIQAEKKKRDAETAEDRRTRYAALADKYIDMETWGDKEISEVLADMNVGDFKMAYEASEKRLKHLENEFKKNTWENYIFPRMVERDINRPPASVAKTFAIIIGKENKHITKLLLELVEHRQELLAGEKRLRLRAEAEKRAAKTRQAKEAAETARKEAVSRQLEQKADNKERVQKMLFRKSVFFTRAKDSREFRALPVNTEEELDLIKVYVKEENKAFFYVEFEKTIQVLYPAEGNKVEMKPAAVKVEKTPEPEKPGKAKSAEKKAVPRVMKPENKVLFSFDSGEFLAASYVRLPVSGANPQEVLKMLSHPLPDESILAVNTHKAIDLYKVMGTGLIPMGKARGLKKKEKKAAREIAA